MLLPLKFLMLAVVVLAAVPVSADDHQRTIQVDYNIFPPFSYHENDPQGPGLLLELFKKAFAHHGLRANISFLPQARIKQVLKSGEGSDFLVCSPEHQEVNNFWVSPAILKMNAVLYQNSAEEPLQSFGQLKNEKIIITLGLNAFSTVFDSSNTFYRPSSIESAVKMFAAGRANYLAEYHERVEFHLNSKLGESSYNQYPVYAVDNFLCLNKDFPGSEQLVKDVYRFIGEYQDTPAGKQLFAKYGVSSRLATGSP